MMQQTNTSQSYARAKGGKTRHDFTARQNESNAGLLRKFLEAKITPRLSPGSAFKVDSKDGRIYLSSDLKTPGGAAMRRSELRGFFASSPDATVSLQASDFGGGAKELEAFLSLLAWGMGHAVYLKKEIGSATLFFSVSEEARLRSIYVCDANGREAKRVSVTDSSSA